MDPENEVVTHIESAPELDNPSVGPGYRPDASATVETPRPNAAGVATPEPLEPRAPAQPDPAFVAQQQQWQYERQALLQETQRQQAESNQMREVLWQIKLANAPEAQRQQLIEQRNQQSLYEQRQANQNQQAQFFQSVEPIMKEVVINGLLNTYRHAGVTKGELSSFSNPEDAERFCQSLARRTRQTAAQKTSPVAHAAQAQGSVSAKGWKGMTLSEQLSAAMAQL